MVCFLCEQANLTPLDQSILVYCQPELRLSCRAPADYLLVQVLEQQARQCQYFDYNIVGFPLLHQLHCQCSVCSRKPPWLEAPSDASAPRASLSWLVFHLVVVAWCLLPVKDKHGLAGKMHSCSRQLLFSEFCRKMSRLQAYGLSQITRSHKGKTNHTKLLANVTCRVANSLLNGYRVSSTPVSMKIMSRAV